MGAVDWAAWDKELRERLGLSVGVPLSKQTLETPWFLVPERAELEPSKSEILFASVRSHLFQGRDSDPGLKRTRIVVRQLTGDEALPLLYSLRSIATFEGVSSTNYWPLVAEHLFRSREAYYNDIQPYLSALFTQIWQRVHHSSGGRLYYPREGRANLVTTHRSRLSQI